MKAIAFASGANSSAVNANSYSFGDTALEYEAENLSRKTNGPCLSHRQVHQRAGRRAVVKALAAAGAFLRHDLV